MKIEFVFEKTCPNITPAREQLKRALAEAGIEPLWVEWEISDPAAPAYIHGYGSPTILINGQDVAGEQPTNHDMSCRIYKNSDPENRGVPSRDDIVAALRRASTKHKSRRNFFKMNMGILPAIGVALLPKIFCPACWPAYAGFLSSLGVGFFDYTPYMLPVMVGFILVALFALVWRASQRRGYGPFILGCVASVILIISKFYLDDDYMMWFGLLVLITASLWNTWPRSQSDRGCPACVS